MALGKSQLHHWAEGAGAVGVVTERLGWQPLVAETVEAGAAVVASARMLVVTHH